jgi:hypothetical protein
VNSRRPSRSGQIARRDATTIGTADRAEMIVDPPPAVTATLDHRVPSKDGRAEISRAGLGTACDGIDHRETTNRGFRVSGDRAAGPVFHFFGLRQVIERW